MKRIAIALLLALVSVLSAGCQLVAAGGGAASGLARDLGTSSQAAVEISAKDVVGLARDGAAAAKSAARDVEGAVLPSWVPRVLKPSNYIPTDDQVPDPGKRVRQDPGPKR